MLHKAVSMIICAAVLSLGTATAAEKFISLDVPGARATTASGINADGAIVGWYVDNAGKTHGFVLIDGGFTTIDYPGAVYTDARGINAEGDIVGCHIEDPSRIPGSIGCHGFLLSNGVFTPVDYPGKYGAIAQRINDAGQIVGCNHGDDGPGGVMLDDMHGFLLSGGNFSQLSTKATMNYGLNADGNVTTGNVTINGFTHGFLASSDVVVPFDFPFSIVTNSYDMTPSGEQIVGAYRDSARKVHGFLLRLAEGSVSNFAGAPRSGIIGSFDFVTIDYPQAIATQPFGISARGEIVGTYVDAAGNRHGFVLGRGSHMRDRSENSGF